MRLSKQQTEKATINVMPFMDIAFMLVLFVVMGLSFQVSAGVSPNIPSSRYQDTSNQPLCDCGYREVVQIYPGRMFRYAFTFKEFGLVESELKQAAVERPGAQVVIVADPDSDFADVLAVHDAALRAGYPGHAVVIKEQILKHLNRRDVEVTPTA